MDFDSGGKLPFWTCSYVFDHRCLQVEVVSAITECRKKDLA